MYSKKDIATSLTLLCLMIVSEGIPGRCHATGLGKCPDNMRDYFQILTDDEMEVLCQIQSRIDISNYNAERTNAKLKIPTPQEMREWIHVESNADFQRKMEQLKAAEQQEKHLRLRHEDNIHAVEIISELRQLEQEEEELLSSVMHHIKTG